MHNATVTYMQADDTYMIINKLAIAFLHTLALLDVTVPPQFFRQLFWNHQYNNLDGGWYS